MDGIIFSGFTFSGTRKGNIQSPQLGPYRIRTYLEENGYTCDIVDWFDFWTEEEILELIKNRYHENLKFIGFSVTFLSLHKIGADLLKSIKNTFPNLKIVFGSQEPFETFCGEHPEKAKYIDIVFYGHSEVAFLEYIKYLDGKPSKHKAEKFTTGVDYVVSPNVLPYTDTSNLTTIWKPDDPLKYFKGGGIEISRGCMFKCKFCFSPLIGRKRADYTRSVENLADELKRNYDLFDTNHYVFSDDTLNESTEKLLDIKKAIELSGVDITFTAYIRYEILNTYFDQVKIMSDMGWVGGILGLETFNSESRKAIGKGLTTEKILDLLYRVKQVNKDVHLSSAFIVGLPGETEESTVNEFETFLKLNKDHEYLDSFYWTPLYIIEPYKYLSSIFAKEASSYGYSVIPGTGKWTNDRYEIKSWDEAYRISNRLNDMCKDNLGTSIQISELLSLGIDRNEFRHIRSGEKMRELIADKKEAIWKAYRKEKLDYKIFRV